MTGGLGLCVCPARRRFATSAYGMEEMVRRFFSLCIIFGATAFSLAFGQNTPDTPLAFDVHAHYTKYEYSIPMRDGKKLFTSVYVPKDSSRSYPLLMNRTPYSVAPYGVDNYRTVLGPSEAFEKSGYIFVYQDVRGRHMSEGTFVEMRPHIDQKTANNDVDDSTDTYDTIDWLLKNVPNNNGRVGIWGISYPGFFTSASIIDSHPALKAASPQAPMTDLFMGDDAYHGGAFMLAANFGFYAAFKPQNNPELPPNNRQPFDYGTANGYDFFRAMGPLWNVNTQYFHGQSFLWNDQLQHNTYDEYWRSRNLAPHMQNIHCAVLTVGGWFDTEDLSGPLRTFHAIDKFNPGIFNALVEGPWVHGGWSRYDGRRLGYVDFASNTGDFFRDQIQFPFFEAYLKDDGQVNLPKAYVFETGTNVWRRYDAWPPKNTEVKTLYLNDKGRLTFDSPTTTADAYDEYVSDPAKPVPFVGYTAVGVPQEYMVSDQRFAATRTDVVVYQSEPLQQDITIAGPVRPKLFVSTTGTDSDFVVKLIDVYPEYYPEPEPDKAASLRDVGQPVQKMAGFEQLIRGEPMRGKFRKSFAKPEPFVPGEMAEVNFEMADINHTFRRGHRIMVQVQSSWFPLTDLNPQTFVNIPDAKPQDFKLATERIYRSQRAPSGIEVLVLHPESR